MPLPTAPEYQTYADTVPDIRHNWIVRGPDPNLALGARDVRGYLYWWEDIEGWFSTPGLDTAITPQGNADRAIAGTRFPRKERYVTIKGVCHVNDPAHNWDARERLVTAWDSPNEYFDLIVEEPVPKKLRVRTVGQVEMDWNQEATMSFGFSIPLVAPSPYKQGLDTQNAVTGPTITSNPTRTYPRTYPLVYDSAGEGGYTSIFNRGNAPALPIFLVTGYLKSGWKIINITTGVELAYDIPINTNQTLTIDTERQTVRVGNFDVQARRVGDWPLIIPGLNQFRFVANNPGPTDEPTLAIISSSAYK